MTRALSIGIASALLASQAMACCIVNQGQRVLMTHENVIIVWDEKSKTQHFIRQASFDSNSKQFGFIVPTPTEPTFSVADDQAFNRLQNLMPVPENVVTDAAAGGMETKSAGVQVIKTEQVGDYQATVIKATNGQAMNDWLKDNDFISRPSMTEWLDNYAKKSWVFTALKYKADFQTLTRTDAIRISFKTDRPHYPYKMPKDTWPDGHNRPLKLYFVAASSIDARYVDTNDNWEAKKQWTGPLPNDQRPLLAKELGLTESDLPANAQVTIFENGRNENGYDEDLMFVAATNIGTYLGGGIVVVLVGAWLMIQRNRRKFVPTPA